MRTTPFKNIFNRVVRLLGRDPLDDITQNMRDGLLDQINDRVETIAKVWNWPEWNITEERAFRQVWNSSTQYKRVSDADGLPDEVFYLGTQRYYVVNVNASSDPPIGSTPADSTGSVDPVFWSVLDPVDPYIAYDQGCRRPIGVVRGVYSTNPRGQGQCNAIGLKFRPSEKGIDVLNSGTPTVFINYSMPVPSYTMKPFVAGKVYTRGQIVYDPTVGECFQALAPTTAVPSDVNFWRRVPFLEKWATYVARGSFADALLEFKESGNEDLQARVVLSQEADKMADDALQMEVDVLAMQGQKLQYKLCHQQMSCWCNSQPWTGGEVTTLTADCQSDLGWVYPSPPTSTAVVWQFRPEIAALRVTGTSPSLDGISTVLLLSGSLVEIVIGPLSARTRQTWQLLTGTADPTDPNGQVAPLDYNAITNQKFWSRVT